MPENSGPNPSPVASGEFNFVGSAPADPRLRRRTLKPKLAPKPAIDPSASSSQAAAQPQPESRRTTESVAPSSPAPVRYATGSPGAKADAPHTPAPGLYYSTGARKEPEDVPAPPMKPSPTTASSTAAATPSPAHRTIGPVSTPARATSLPDYRANIDRQAREQKSVGGVLAIVVYVLIGFFVLSACLAGYGTYTLSRQIHHQSVTMNDLDVRYAAENKALTTSLASTDANLALTQTQLRREQDIILRQQDTINKLVSANDATVSALRQERSTRAGEEASLRARVHVLENQPRLNP
jgi:hypothetical protein